MPAPVFGADFGYLKIDSERRERELARVIKRSYKLDLDIPDDRLTHVLVAHYLEEHGEADPDLEDLARHIVARRERDVPTSLSTRLIEAREIYESFFDGDLPRNVPGWTDDLISVAADLYTKPAFEIAVAVWAADRGRAKRRYTPSSVRPPQLEFDHRLLGFGKYVMLSRNYSKTEPFFEVRRPVEGVCGVNRAWMFLGTREVDTYSSELVSYFKSELPEWHEFIQSVDQPIGDRPLGFHAIPFAAEAFARHLTIQEGAEFVFDQLTEVVRKNAPNAPN